MNSHVPSPISTWKHHQKLRNFYYLVLIHLCFLANVSTVNSESKTFSQLSSLIVNLLLYCDNFRPKSGFYLFWKGTLSVAFRLESLKMICLFNY